eukprot:TRINITY_DN24720_c0_g1_i1.p1 TRINITY_DN24720_c0_g1~~TRINITY_DN24720_c0_g1_i1.p1  ORF type:complete len:552 (-),score=142.83 TRINITY_DN24720_c0_g1_i1:70-1725(-)
MGEALSSAALPRKELHALWVTAGNKGYKKGRKMSDASKKDMRKADFCEFVELLVTRCHCGGDEGPDALRLGRRIFRELLREDADENTATLSYEEFEAAFQAYLEDVRISRLLRAPKILYVTVPSSEAECAGRYELMEGELVNDFPIWKMRNKNYWFFSGPGCQWFIGDEDEKEDKFDCDTGHIASHLGHYGTMPDKVHQGGWQRFDNDSGQWIDDPHVAVTSVVPTILMVVCPGAHDCGGMYELVPDDVPNGYPLWKMKGKQMWLFSGTTTQWFVGDESEFKDKFNCNTGYMSTHYKHNGLMPDKVKEWQRVDKSSGVWVDDDSIAVSQEIPACLYVGVPNVEAECAGIYKLLKDEAANGLPLWKMPEKPYWMFSGPGGQWFIGDEDEESDKFDCNTGHIASHARHYGRMPDKMAEFGGWQKFDADEEKWVKDGSIHVSTHCPSAFSIHFAGDDAELEGLYELLEDEVANGWPLWKLDGKPRWLFSTPGGQWFIGGEAEKAENFACNTGYIASPDHLGHLPHLMEVGCWQSFDAQEQKWTTDASIRVAAVD